MVAALTSLIDETDSDNDASSNVEQGMITDVKNLYQSKPDGRNMTTWVDKYPDDLEEAAEDAESARYALLIRNRKCYDGRKKLQIDSIVVQSPLIKQVLGSVLKDYPGITTTLDRLTFKAPFQPFIHRWKNFLEALESEHDSETQSHLGLLHRILEAELRDDLRARDDFILNGVITYSTIWMIFEPGTIVFTVKDGHNCAARFNNDQFQETECGNWYALSCQIVDWDGENFGYGKAQFKVREFEGTMEITKLSVYPLEYHPDLSNVKEALVQRGKAFKDLSGYHYKSYHGVAIGEGLWGPIKYNVCSLHSCFYSFRTIFTSTSQVHSRIIIDTYAWNRFNPNKQFSEATLSSSLEEAPSVKSVEYSDDHGDDGGDYNNPIHWRAGRKSQPFLRPARLPDIVYNKDDGYESDEVVVTVEKSKLTSLTNDQLLLCSASLKGYSLKNKKWLTFYIDCVLDIEYSDSAFESLVLPSDHKELILALAESQVQHKDGFDDVIQGKGKGMIMLLSGPPGVGKTLTAESGE